MFDFLKRNKRVCGAHAPQYRRGTNPPRPSKTPPMPSVAPPRSETPVYKAPPMPYTAPCKDESKLSQDKDGVMVIEFNNDVVSDVKVYGLEDSVRASKYPKSVDVSLCTTDVTDTINKLGTADIGSGHDNFLNGIVVQFDLRFTVKAWTEEERYHFIDFISSQSTMHRITQFDLDKSYIRYVDNQIINRMKELVAQYNENPCAENFLVVVYSNPCGFQLTARMTTNYRQLKTIYSQRKTHRLPEWRSFCEFCKALPHSEWITGNKE